MDKNLLSQKALAERWEITEPTLGAWRWSGTGPRYTKIGRKIFYKIKDVEAFEEKNVRTSTADTGDKDQFKAILENRDNNRRRKK